MAKYTESDAVKKLREQMEAQSGLKPAEYTSKWQPQIDSTVNDILNRKDFQYDVNADALYNQYKDRYTTLGQQAMMDTMGQAAKLTGGYGNSNAQIAGQQAYQSYLHGLTDKIPELASMAFDRYNQQGQNLYNRYNLLNAQEQNAYNQWNDMYSKWLTERDYTANRYDTERGYDYGQHRDTVADSQWQTQFDENNRQWQTQFDESNRQWQAAFDEDLRRFNYQNNLGEFAPVAGSGGYDDEEEHKPKKTEPTVQDELRRLGTLGTSTADMGRVIDAAIKDGVLSDDYWAHYWAWA